MSLTLCATACKNALQCGNENTGEAGETGETGETGLPEFPDWWSAERKGRIAIYTSDEAPIALSFSAHLTLHTCDASKDQVATGCHSRILRHCCLIIASLQYCY